MGFILHRCFIDGVCRLLPLKLPTLCCWRGCGRAVGGRLLCILSMCTHTPPVAVVLKALLCVCEWCEGCTDTEPLQIILKVNISLAGRCLRWSLLSSSEEDFNLPRCKQDTKQACDAKRKTSNCDSREAGARSEAQSHKQHIPLISVFSIVAHKMRAQVSCFFPFCFSCSPSSRFSCSSPSSQFLLLLLLLSVLLLSPAPGRGKPRHRLGDLTLVCQSDIFSHN